MEFEANVTFRNGLTCRPPSEDWGNNTPIIQKFWKSYDDTYISIFEAFPCVNAFEFRLQSKDRELLRHFLIKLSKDSEYIDQRRKS